jgi:hypothetical protein
MEPQSQMKKIFLQGLKVGLLVNLVSIIFAGVYVLIIESFLFKPVERFVPSLKLGTVADHHRIFARDVPSMQERESWLRIQNHFDFFVPEYQLRADYLKPSPRLLKWCRFHKCFAHRIAYGDIRKKQFKYFTLDDWWSNNKYLIFKDTSADELQLDNFLKSLPDGSLVLISEPFSIFSERRSLTKFLEWALALRSQHPNLKFEIGLQIHLQWIDAWWVRHRWVLFELQKFSKVHTYPWGVSEFSNYDRVWKRRLSGRSPVDRFFYQMEGLVPQRLRRAIVSHQVYQIHRDAVYYGAVRFVEWGNTQQTAWFVNEIDSEYRSNYELFDSNGKPTVLWWAAMRGLKDG